MDLAIERNRGPSVDGIHQLGGGQDHMQQVSRSGEGAQSRRPARWWLSIDSKLSGTHSSFWELPVIGKDTGSDMRPGHHQGADCRAKQLGLMVGNPRLSTHGTCLR